MIGIESNRADLKDYSTEYKMIAKTTISILEKLIGNKVEKIEHVGSTAIIGIKSKPIIDIVIGVNSLDIVGKLREVLEQNNFMYAKVKLNNTVVSFKCEKEGKRTHNIYFVIFDGERWKEFVCFKNCLNGSPSLAIEYEKLKIDLSKKYCNDIHKYTEGKSKFISDVLKNYKEK